MLPTEPGLAATTEADLVVRDDVDQDEQRELAQEAVLRVHGAVILSEGGTLEEKRDVLYDEEAVDVLGFEIEK